MAERFVVNVKLFDRAPFFGKETGIGEYSVNADDERAVPSIPGHSVAITHDSKPGGESKVDHLDDHGYSHSHIVLNDNQSGELNVPQTGLQLGSVLVRAERVPSTQKLTKKKSK